jgi:hypothetical protein
VFECGGSAVEDECGECGGDGSSCACYEGDVNGDGALDVLDVVLVVSYILDNAPFDGLECADMNADGNVDVLDVVSMVGVIINLRAINDATEANLNIQDGVISLDADGFIGAVQITLSHGTNFLIDLTNEAMVADYRTNNRSTTAIIVVPESKKLCEIAGDFSVEHVAVYNSQEIISTSMPSEFVLSKAYPNPFNPSTSFNVYVPAEGVVNMSVYNVMGQLVDVILWLPSLILPL